MSVFLSYDNILAIHDFQMKKYGGLEGVKAENLLQSALYAPQQQFAHVPLHGTIYAQAAAYLFYLCSNHPFLDGNKRVAAMACHVYLLMNGKELSLTSGEFYSMIMDVAKGNLDKNGITSKIEKACELEES